MSLPRTVGGYVPDQFVKDQDLEKHQCGICLLICKETVHLPCTHLFCRECIGRWVVTKHNTCPFCRAGLRGHLDITNVVPDPVQSLLVSCDNVDCKWTGALKDRNLHKQKECEKELHHVACPCCKFYGPPQDYRQHKCADLSGECLVCRNSLAKLCITCEAEMSYESAKTAVCHYAQQMCGHTFHNHCLARWARTRPSCPLCDQPLTRAV